MRQRKQASSEAIAASMRHPLTPAGQEPSLHAVYVACMPELQSPDTAAESNTTKFVVAMRSSGGCQSTTAQFRGACDIVGRAVMADQPWTAFA